MKKIQKLPTEIKSIWRINAAVDFFITLVIALGFFIWRNFSSNGFQKVLSVIIIISVSFAIISLISELSLINYHWKYWTYFVDERQVELHYGFFFQKEIVIPISRVQNVTLSQGPFLRLKDLQKITVQTAAGAKEIDGLKTTEANKIKDLIMRLAREAKNDI
ncbi:PH domain-containing protein [Companilactobacillus halodurans]|uniref:YdbS-like PH domain-containing protein n=1 Tax=Companilactobacillus halodurans TaxID=2584183 RepID=A0A5P0ZTG5_9LACO|nr:PH domain-containing protein [Companilactobacillus halodurans]MQS77432.1 hypothetical protein [Companilactobacillus halodurans]MQS98617.1 hypothetical protein [Companilactobacillus halodurans]